jgi:hypothetical protein
MGWSVSATITMAKRYEHIGDSSSRRAMSVSIFSTDGIRIESALELVYVVLAPPSGL